ncbi:MAG: glycoside hydrolase family 31 protein [Cyclobacteriaceae bacterium]|nr:glycoside hydrolase family 31 protein [Cyclobacteriaceae bacterium]MCH8516614.1 glycoside hydrolase family 31 protein [Cyclobacteriaceae bacterium]
MNSVSYSKAQRNLSKSLGDLSDLELSGNELRGTTTHGNFRVIQYRDDIFRISITKEESFDDFTYAVVAEPEEKDMKVEETTDKITISSSKATLEITKSPVRFTLLNADGKEVLADDPAFGTSWIGDQITTYKKLRKDERFIGLGEKTGPLDRRGEGYENYNTDYFAYPEEADPLYVSTPFYIGLFDDIIYGVYLDNSSKSHFNFGASNDRFSSFAVEQGDMDYYLFVGDDTRDILAGYSHVTGMMSMPPKWSLGYQQCRYSYYPDTEILSVAKNFRDRKIPADVMYFDIHYMDKYKIFTWDENRFPDPEGMLNQLSDMGFQSVIIVDPGIKVEKGYKAYEEGIEGDFFIKYPDGTNYTGQVWPGWCHFPDFTKPEAREWWGKSFEGYVNDGIRGFWNDMNEIATWGQTLPELIEFDFEGRKATTREARNIYGMKMSQSTFEGTRKLLKGERPFILTRAGFSGIQRYSAVWTGDNVATDEHMMLGVRLVNSLGLTGVPYAGYDVGGFEGDPTVDLYGRWLSIGAFSPFFRGHTQINTRSAEPWTYGEEVEEIVRNYINMRYRLTPYLYSTFFEATHTGLPISRSLAIDHAFDPNIYKSDFENQYTFGESILIAPVRSEQKLAKVYLPKGDWYDLYNGEKFEGGKTHKVESPINRLPIFVKGGAILPMQSIVQNHAEDHDGILRVHIYNGNEDTAFELYEDDGKTYEFEEGNFLKRKIRFSPTKQEIVLEEAEGSYSTDYKEVKIILHGFNHQNKYKLDGKKTDASKEMNRFFEAISKFDPVGDENEPEEYEVHTFQISNTNNAIKLTW